MKVLKFLINSNYELLTRSLVDYLIDSGHFVFIYSNDKIVNDKWLTEYEHNLCIIGKDKLKSQKFDYLIDFYNQISLSDLIKINFNLALVNGGFLITSWLEKNGKNAVIYQTVTPNYSKDKLKYLITEITEVFIDTIVYLLRFGDKTCEFKHNKKYNNDTIVKFIQYELQLEQLDSYYKSLKQENDKIFFIQNLVSSNKLLISYTERIFKIDHAQINSNNINIEILAIYILYILNSRSEGIYGYEICSAKEGTNTDVTYKLTKFINIKLDESYNTILEKCNNELYDIINNVFFSSTKQVSEDIKPGIAIAYDCEINSEEYLLSIIYNSKNGEVAVRYAKNLYFFDDFEHHLNNFVNKFDNFYTENIIFQELLNLPQDYLVKYISTWNDTKVEFLNDTTIHSLFEEQVEKTPDNIAVIHEEIKLTYFELNTRSNQLANYIRHIKDVKPDDLIVLCLDKSEHMLITIIAVLKAGGAYVPIDPNYPDERIKYILQETKTKVILTNEKYKERLKEISMSNIMDLFNSSTKANDHPKILTIDSNKLQERLVKESTNNPSNKTASSNLAYVIYTSGTTGNPKGVMSAHTGLVNLKYDLARRYKRINEDNNEVILQASNYIFDASIKNIVFSILSGYTLVIPSSFLWLDSEDFCNYLNTHKITYIDATPTFLGQYDLSNAITLKNLIVGGEYVTRDFYNKLDLTNNLMVMNSYGPTEASVTSIVNQIQDGNLAIGRPMSNITAYVLDAQLNLLPIGVIGELYIGGVCLARGYFNKPELTVEKFIANPFNNEKEKKQQGLYSRLYRTGDLVRWLPDGNLEYLGRNDFQVKIRGHRIELEEIESALSSYNGIKQNVVLAKEHIGIKGIPTGNKYLVAYYVSNHKLNEEDIYNYLQSKLPEYMVPAALIHLYSLPITLNGKLDRKALPEPEFTNDNDYVAPTNPLESKMCTVWAEVLGLHVNQIGIYDDFFKLGGDSISLMKLVSKLNNEFQSNIKFKDIFSSKTVKALSILVKNSIGNSIYKDYVLTQSDTLNLFKQFPLSNVQQAYYFGRFSNFELGNISTHTYGEYNFDHLNIEALERSLNKLINRHPALRTIFLNSNQQYLQTVPYYKVKVYELLDELDLLNVRNQLSHKVYTPETYPLFDIVVSKLNNCFILHISIDALLMDANSFRVLFTELTLLYNNSSIVLPTLDINYRDYLLRYKEIRSSELFREHEKYWLSKLEDFNFDVNLPLEIDPADVKNPKFKRQIKVIPSNIWNKLLSKVTEKNISPTALILAVYGKVMCYWTGQDRVCINLTLFNRLPLHKQIDMVIGDFTMLELFNYVDKNKNSITESLKNIHEELWNDIDHNLFDGLDFQRLIRKQKSLSNDKVLAPIILTSILGNKNKDHDVLVDSKIFIDKSYKGVNYSTNQTSQAWLDNQVYEINEGLVVQWDYVEQLFDKEIIMAMHDTYCKLIESLAELNWDKEAIPLVTLPSKDKAIIELANDSKQEFNIYKENTNNITLLTKFTNIAQNNSLQANIAVIEASTGKEYSYKQLLLESEYLGKYLVLTDSALNVNSETKLENSSHQIYPPVKLIAVLAEKGYNQVVSILSIMKAGKAYLPLNVDWPIARLEELLEQARAKAVLISRSQYKQDHIRRSLSKNYQLLVIEDILQEISINKQLESKVAQVSFPIIMEDDIAYVIFTSGSTGKPKGVTISHKGALNTIEAINSRFNISSNDKVLALSDLSFDLSVYDIFGMLSAGGAIVFPVQDKVKETVSWVELISKHQITIWNTVPQLAGLLIDEASNGNLEINPLTIQSLRLFLLSGDWVPTSILNIIKQYCPHSTVMSLGGATEGSIWSIWYEIDYVNEEWDSIPYGVAMPNQKMYVLNHTSEHCPIGVIGEIHIGGIGVAINYYRDHQKTNESFINHRELGRLYKTGDLGRWHSNGYIEFIGRKDCQIKVNGYRVELGEIAAKLTKLEGVEAAFVKIQKEKDQDFIVGYLLFNECGKELYIGCNTTINLQEIVNKALSKNLPQYMLPYDYIVIDNLPLSSNGKLEVNKLPLLKIQENSFYVAPRNSIEAKMCQIYVSILHLNDKKVGITDDFFRLGGNSLLAMQLIGKINRELGMNLTLADLYNYKAIKSISDDLRTEDAFDSSKVGII